MKGYIAGKNLRNGQSMVEVLIAVVIGVILIIGAIAVIGPSLRVDTESKKMNAGTAYGRELLNNVKVFAEANWHNISNLSTSSANHYYINASSSPFSAVSGEEEAIIASTTYTRYFYVDDVYRDANSKITSSGGTYDPSTKKITVVYSWPKSASYSIEMYITRSKNNIFRQTDWSGGAGQEGPITDVNNKYATSSNIDANSSTGSIFLDLQ